MILTKKYLNELTQQRVIHDSVKFSKSSQDNQTSFDVFVSYSFSDKAYAIKVVNLLIKAGYKVYIDLFDSNLSRDKVSKETARRIAIQMDKCKGLLYLHSKSASVSKWCPWELGYFSGKKNFRCASLPLKEYENDSFPNQEFLELYPYTDYVNEKDTGKGEFWINERETGKYTSLKSWLNGAKLVKH